MVFVCTTHTGEKVRVSKLCLTAEKAELSRSPPLAVCRRLGMRASHLDVDGALAEAACWQLDAECEVWQAKVDRLQIRMPRRSPDSRPHRPQP